MKNAMGNISGEIAGCVGEQQSLDNVTAAGKGHNTEFSAHQNKRFVFFRVKMAVRPDVGTWLNGIKQAVASGFI